METSTKTNTNAAPLIPFLVTFRRSPRGKFCSGVRFGYTVQQTITDAQRVMSEQSREIVVDARPLADSERAAYGVPASL